MPARSEKPSNNLHAEVTARIVAELEAGSVPWVQPWASSTAPLSMPRNLQNGRRYSGINVILLWFAIGERGWTSGNFLTYRQAQAAGGQVRRGSKGVTVVYANRFVPERERERAESRGDEPAGIPFLRRFTVFNENDIEGLPTTVTGAPEVKPEELLIAEAQQLIEATGADVRVGGGKAYYNFEHDFVAVPPASAFFARIDQMRTVCHEAVHWTAHASRLGRDLSGAFGSELYAREELTAELGASFLLAELGIRPTVRHSDYIANWLQVIRSDDRAIFRAASAASKAADYLLGFRAGVAPELTDDDAGEVIEAFAEAA